MASVTLSSSAGKWLMASAILASSMAFIDGTALNVVLPALQKSLHATGEDLFWILNAYLLILAALILVGGSLGDRLGRKKIFMIGIFVFILGSAACGFSPNVFYLIAFRSIQGLGGALMIPGSLSLISASIDDREKGRAIGTWSAITTVVTMGGPILGGALADAGFWRGIFFINVPIGIAALIVLWFKVAESKEEHPDPRLDYFGALSIAVGLALVTFGFLRAPSKGFGDIPVIAALGGGVLLLGLFLAIERRTAYPMMPLRLFSNATFSGANLLTFFLYAGLGAAMLFISLNLVQAQGYSQLESGLTFLPFTILMIFIARFAGALADRKGPRLLLIIGPFIAGAGMLGLSMVGITKGPGEYWTTFFPGFLLLGLGMAITVAPLTTAVMSAVSDDFSGTASGVNNAVSRVSNVFANAIFGAMAVWLFSGALNDLLSGMDPSVRTAALGQAVDLGNAHVPAGVPSVDAPAIAHAYRLGFVQTYQIILRIAAGLAWLGALMGALFIRNKKH